MSTRFRVSKAKVLFYIVIFIIITYLSIKYFQTKEVRNVVVPIYTDSSVQTISLFATKKDGFEIDEISYSTTVMRNQNKSKQLVINQSGPPKLLLDEPDENETPKDKSTNIPQSHPNKVVKKSWNIPKPKVHETISTRSKPIITSDYCGNNDLVIVFCMSTAENVANRNAIRDTWGNQNRSYNQNYKKFATLKYQVVFVIGRALSDNPNLVREISDEISQNNDIIELDFQESRYEYTRKFIAALKWLNSISCVNVKFVLRIIDDVFLNIPPFMNWLTAVFIGPQQLEKIYLGHVIKQDEPIRNIQHPLYTNSEDYPDDMFPDYIKSPIYLFSFDTFACMNKQRKNVALLPMEDAFIGLLAVKCSISARHNEHFVLLGRPDNVCHHRHMFFIGNIKPIEEVNVFRKLSQKANSECSGIEEDKEL